jgi:DNA-binding NarL/FixJ family response regulator
MRNTRPEPRLPAVAIVAADRRVRDSVASLLNASGQVRVIGAAGDADAALRLVDAGDPQVVVLDRGLSNGAAKPSLLTRLRQRMPEARILVIEWDAEGVPAVAEGADAVLDLADQPSALVEAVLSTPVRPTSPAAAD